MAWLLSSRAARTGVERSMGRVAEDRLSTLIIGGTGYVGAGISLFLHDRGHRVTSTGQSGRPVFDQSAIHQIRFNLLKDHGSTPLPGSEVAIIAPWIEVDNEASTPWMDNLLDGLSAAGTGAVIYFSTMWVYGQNPEGTLSESSPVSPSGPYGDAHLRNEDILTRRAGDMHLDVTILRMSNLVGPDPCYPLRVKIDFVHELMAMAVDDGLIELRSKPSTPRNVITRSLLHHYLAAIIDRSSSPGHVEILNIGGTTTMTMLDLARRIALTAEHYHGRPVRLTHPEDAGETPRFHLDTSMIRSLAGPCPEDLDAELSAILKDIVDCRTRTDEKEGP